ncbi:hypothetical protein N7532_011405 [Penicillium argentinense]|uniref:Uncharacterized protein n=1 Tax=Penicillium argentinense TaxID=1131581 RepID=A0A9W9EIC5_9EURO|nr:uncharacterized protein N7532_011405 [Penicillium argentinense]KAJ5082362.1 hypothetical protein N7532_011405 [Penicillium argentinense]
MSCSPVPRPEPDSSDYGTDFTEEEDELLNELLAAADAQHAPVRSDAISTSTSTPNFAVPTTENANIVTTPELPVPGSLQPAIYAALVADIEDGIEGPSSPRLPKVLPRENPRSPWKQASQRQWFGSRGAGSYLGCPSPGPSNSNRSSPFVEHPNSSEGRERERERSAGRELAWTQEAQAAPMVDSRTPVERFRHKPNKAFSVTDLVSPAWCELQYWYTLTKHGRKRRTSAMKKGSVVHKSLEDELYTTVPVEITTKEDAWALRIWNVIQGLRLLREYGVTRELEVWGLIDGEVVNGVIDQLSYKCPDSELEKTAAGFYEDAAASRVASPEYQMSLSDFLLSSSQGGRRLSDIADIEHVEESPPVDEESMAVFGLPRIYMTDVKTKANGSAPTVKSTSFRPTLLQLQLYYHMLNRLITSDDVNIDVLATRYDFDSERPFTEPFISEVGCLNNEFFDADSSEEPILDDLPDPDDAGRRSSGSPSASRPPKSSQESTDILVTHRNLSSLWGYMKKQLRFTFLHSPSPNSSSVAPSIPSHSQPKMLEEYHTLLSPVLTARYVSSTPTSDLQPRHIGSRSFLFDPDHMKSYITEQMEWWRGQRDPRGVNVVEAWKCRICEFNDECTWRQERAMEYARRNTRWRSSASADI